MRRKDDILWKGILEDVFDDFLRFFDPEAEQFYNLNKKFEFLDKELAQVFPPENDEYSPKVVDKLVKVFTREGNEEWVLVHVEVQGQYQQDFARRMFTYFYRILDKYQKPITAYAIFTEAVNAVRPDSFQIKFRGTSLSYIFNTYKISRQDEGALLASNNPFAMVILTAKAALSGRDYFDKKERDGLLLKLKLELARHLLIKQIPKKKIRVLMNFLKYYVRFENPDINIKFEEQMQVLTKKTYTMGIEEQLLDRAKREGLEQGIEKGLEKGLEKGKHDVVENLITELNLSDEQIARIAEVTISFVEKIRSKISG